MTISKVIFTLDDLQNLLPSLADGDSHKQRQITKSFISMIMLDCNFTRIRDVYFAITLTTNWKDIVDSLRETPEIIEMYLHKYIAAFNDFRLKHPKEIRTLSYNPATKEYMHGFSIEDFYYFSTLESGFRMYLDLLNNDSPQRCKYLLLFQLSLRNETLVKQLYDGDFSGFRCKD